MLVAKGIGYGYLRIAYTIAGSLRILRRLSRKRQDTNGNVPMMGDGLSRELQGVCLIFMEIIKWADLVQDAQIRNKAFRETLGV